MSATRRRAKSAWCRTGRQRLSQEDTVESGALAGVFALDRHGDAIDNFFRNFYRQCKEPTRFGFYRVAADMVEALLPVIKDLLRDPAANAELLAPHKVDTSAYQQAEEQQAAEEVKKK